jgi:tight adherence protein C
MEETLAPALACSAAVLAVAAVAARRDRGVGGRLPRGPERPSRRGSVVARIGAVPALRHLAPAEVLSARLAAAGSERSVEEVVGAKWLCAAGAACVMALLPGPAPLLLPVAALGGFILPDMILARAARRRRSRADREIPLFLDLLAAASSAGLTGQLAVRRAAEATEGPLAEAIRTALGRVDLGGRWRDELIGAADRLDLPDLRRAASVLTRSDAIGSSLVEGLAEIAAESRDTRRALVAERARTAPVKMLFPLVFLVLPAFLLLTVVPVLVTTLRSIH